MSEVEKNRALALKFFDAMARSDVAAIIDALDDEGAIQTMGKTLISGVYNKEQLKKYSAAIFSSFPKGLEIKVYNVIAEGEYVAVEAESRGPHVSGKIYNNFYHFLFHFRNGKIIKLKEYLDTEHVTEVLCGGKRPPATA